MREILFRNAQVFVFILAKENQLVKIAPEKAGSRRMSPHLQSADP